MGRIVWTAIFAALLLAGPPTAHAEVLITEAEARLPDADTSMRGVTRGPGIEQLSPNPNRGISSPIPLLVKFVPRNNVPIDPASVKLTYLKAQPIELTERIRQHVTEDGIDMAHAEAPPGTHIMRLEIKDRQGRTGTALLKLVIMAR